LLPNPRSCTGRFEPRTPATLKITTSLSQLSLVKKACGFVINNLNSCVEISEVGLGHLKQGLQRLTSLQNLSLNFAQ